MKKFYLFIILSLSWLSGYSQSAASYTFSAYSGTYSSIAPVGIAVPALLSDDISQLNIPIGFTFNFCGINYTQLGACVNGFLSLANSSTTTFNNVAGNVVSAGMLMPYWDDLYGNATTYGCSSISHAYYTTTGAAPNRIFTFEWKDFQAFAWTGVCTCCTINFQVKLYEGTNIIEYVYGPSSYSGMSATIGIANSTTDWQTLLSAGPAPVASASVFTTSISTAPAAGQVYRWTNQCSGMPATGAVNATMLSGCSAYTSVLTLPSSTVGLGISYQWESSPNGITWTPVSGATNSSYVAMVTATAWYRSTIVCSYSGLSATSAGVELYFSSPPAGISGPSTVCEGASITLTDPSVGGVWSSSNAALASIGSSSGIVNGVAHGTAIITYTLPGGCNTISAVTVLPGPTLISGGTVVCTGALTPLTNGTAGGVWTSGNPSIATIDPASGVVLGMATGYAAITYSLGSCSASAAVTVNQSPLPVSGPSSVCIGSSITLNDGTAGGSWASGNPAVAIAGSSSGVISGISSGAIVVSYVMPGGCSSNYYVTVNPLPSSITGASAVCVGETVALSCSGAGLWSSSNPAIAKVGSASGVVVGVAAGSVRTTFSLLSGCFTTFSVTVNPLPAPISGISALCVGANNILTDATPGGVWSVPSRVFMGVNPLSGLDTGFSAGVVAVAYTLPATGCTTSKVITVNPLPAPISGSARMCVGASVSLSEFGGGLWSSGSPPVAAIDAGGTVMGISAGTATISYSYPTGCAATIAVSVLPLPAPILGYTSVCEGGNTILSDATPGGTWATIDTIVTIGSSSGIVTGIAAGRALIRYMNAVTGCFTAAIVTVNPVPPPASGPFALCIGSSITQTDILTGGTWSTGNPSVAAIGSMSGLLTGVSMGSTALTYTSPAGCKTTSMVTVTAAPSAIAGPATVCVNATAALTNSVSGGVWSSSTATAGVGSLSGLVTGVSAGSSFITYSLGPGCTVSRPITVVAAPAAISGPMSVCTGSTASLSDATAPGIWSSGNTSIAAIGSASGVALGVAGGVVVITYTGATGCRSVSALTVNPTPASITGPATLCTGSSVTEADVSPGGIWSSAASNIIIGSATGVVTGFAAGIAPITYSIGGCNAYTIMTVNVMAPITGITGICAGFTTILSDATAGGAWSSSNPPIASIAASGVVTGTFAGTALIAYTLSPGCVAVTTVNVNSGPSAISGSRNVCLGNTSALGNSAAGGAWASGDPLIAAIGSSSGIVTGIATGTVSVTYSLGSGCSTSAVVTVNAIPPAVTGPSLICIGSSASWSDGIAGGIWSSNMPAIASVNPTGRVAGLNVGAAVISYSVNGCAVATGVTVNALPSAVSGPDRLCAGSAVTFTDVPAGGIWSSGSITAAVGSSGIVTGLSAGLAVISYSPGIGCSATKIITIDPLPAGITGATGICAGGSETLGDLSPGGTWSSGTPAIAAISSSGVITGLSGGVGLISYAMPTGCSATRTVSVIVVPPIMGLTNLCAWGDTVSVFDAGIGGTYTSTSVSVTNLGAGAGTVTTRVPGPASITYTLIGYGCSVTQLVTVNPLPAPISGSDRICHGFTMTYTDASTGGVWSSSNAAVASINPVTGLAVASAAGSTHLIYKLSTGCRADTIINVVNTPAAITGSAHICSGSTSSLADASPGGVWASSNSLIAAIDTAGSVVAHAAGIASITYSTAPSCVAIYAVTVNAPPVVYNLTGGGNYCSAGVGLHVGLSGSQSGTAYQLYNGTTPGAGSVAGTGAALDFGLLTAAGVYTATATDPLTGCSNSMAGSAAISITPSVVPAVTVAAVPGDDVCVGTLTSFNAAAVNGGSSPAYQWSVNGVVAATGISYAYIPLNADVVSVQLSSNAPCATPAAASDAVTMIVNEMLVPSVSINAQPGIAIVTGQYDTLTAAVLNAGSSPMYQWTLNGNPVPGETNASYISNSFANGDVVSCVVTSTGLCGGISGTGQATLSVSADHSAVDRQSAAAAAIFTTPNPSKGFFTVSGQLPFDAADVTLKITDMLGRMVYSRKAAVHNGYLLENISLGSAADGVYLLSIHTGNNVISRPVVIGH